MPIYEYECLQCGKRTEWLQRMSDGPLAACPQCGGEVRKLISAPSFQFKGSGFYKTDYVDKDKKSSSGKSEGKSESSSESKSESSSEGKSESKPESKSESSSTPAASESKSTATKSE
jgi:putative FmdB family regulatory protein